MRITLFRKNIALIVAVFFGTITIAILNYYWITNHDLGSSLSRAVILGVIALAVIRMVKMFR